MNYREICSVQRRWKYFLAFLVFLLLSGAGPAMGGTTINVGGGNVADLIQAINDANSEVPPFDGADTIVLDGSTFTLDAVDNSAFGDTGLPVISSEITIEGNGSTIERDSGAPDFNIFTIEGAINNANLTLNGLTVSGGVADLGGGVFNIDGTTTITDSTISGNDANVEGGGIFNGGTLTIMNSTISDNDAVDDGGGIDNEGTATITDSTISGNTVDDVASVGGGISNDDGGDLTLNGSTLSGNSAVNAGGGIFNEDMLTITNSTISGNNQTGDASTLGGGGVANQGTLTITNSTVTNNNAVAPAVAFASGITTFGNPAMVSTTIAGSIVASQQTGTDCGTFDGTSITTNGGNIESGTSCDFTDVAMWDLQNTDPLLGPLADNGGFTQTHALLLGSPAINAMLPANCPPPATDQRGVTRPQGASCDSGSFELQEVNITPGTGDVFASINVDPSLTGGSGQILVDLPPEVEAEGARIDPDVGSCVIDPPQENALVLDADVICDVNAFPENLDLILDLCRDGDQQGTVNSVVEVILDAQPAEEFENIIQILLDQLQDCGGDGNGGCMLMSAGKTNTSNSLINVIVLFIPVVFGFVGLIRKRKDRI